jgi:hypothetical protein
MRYVFYPLFIPVLLTFKLLHLYQLNSLKCRTGAETILYTTRGSTDLPLRGVSITTEGVQTFMASVMGIDNQDLVMKMEGFAIQGIKGS